MIVVRSETQADEGAGIWHGFRLPTMVGLITAHRVFAGLIPGSFSFRTQVMFPDQRLLDLLRTLRIDLLLAARRPPS